MPSVDITVLGGLPVTVEFSIDPADPSVGIMGEALEDVKFCKRGTSKELPFVETRINAIQGEMQRVEDAIWEALAQQRKDDDGGYEPEDWDA